jgi:hypothetical protein
MTTKLKIDLSLGLLEVEGSESFVKAIYNDFKAHFIGEESVGDLFRPAISRRTRTTKATARISKSEPAVSAPEQTLPSKVPIAEPVVEPQQRAVAKPKPKARSPKPSYTFLEKLDLSASQDKPSLVEFMDAKFPVTNEERNLVFLHYLQHIRKIKPITVDHIYTCYRVVKIRVPISIEKSLHMAAHWINISKTGRLSVTAVGKRYVEKQLPKKSKG